MVEVGPGNGVGAGGVVCIGRLGAAVVGLALDGAMAVGAAVAGSDCGVGCVAFCWGVTVGAPAAGGGGLACGTVGIPVGSDMLGFDEVGIEVVMLAVTFPCDGPVVLKGAAVNVVFACVVTGGSTTRATCS